MSTVGKINMSASNALTNNVHIKPDAALFFYFPEGRCEHDIAVHAMDWALTVQDLDNDLRNLLKYGHKTKSADAAFEYVRDQLRMIMENHGVILETIE